MTVASERSSHTSNAETLAYLRTAPPAIEVSQPVTSSMIPSMLQRPNLPSVDSESFKNILRIVQASIGLFFGATNSEQLQELSNNIVTSSLSSTQRSNHTPMSSTSSATKVSTLTKATQTEDLVQTSGKCTSSSVYLLKHFFLIHHCYFRKRNLLL
jgi:hypothetical protein